MKKTLLLTLLFTACHVELPDGTFYAGAAILLETTSFFTRLAWRGSLLVPWADTLGKECLFVSDLCQVAALRAFSQSFKNAPISSSASWDRNQTLLSQIPVSSDEDELLLSFLERRWLAKTGGFRSLAVDWACPCFGIVMQTHPETTSSYARSPSIGLSRTYINRMESWKQSLPQPKDFPLILTRPADLHDYLPSHLVDLTDHITEKIPEKWLQTWKRSPNHQPFSIQKVEQGDIGGLRLLPISSQSKKETASQYQYLLEWISIFGLTANRVELDRWPTSRAREAQGSVSSLTKEEFAAVLNSFEQSCRSDHPQKAIMIEGTKQVLQGLLGNLSEAEWGQNPTKTAVAQLSFFNSPYAKPVKIA